MVSFFVMDNRTKNAVVRALREASHVLNAARPIQIDKQSIAQFVEMQLVPVIVRNVEKLANKGPDRPIGSMRGFAKDFVMVRVPGNPRRGPKNIRVDVRVDSRASRKKGAIVLAGAAGQVQRESDPPTVKVVLYLNGAYRPTDIIGGVDHSLGSKMSFKNDILQPIGMCKSESCLPYGLYSILIHEITHAAEAVFGSHKSGGVEWSSKDNEHVVLDRKKYINTPTEVRAFMQQVVDEVTRYFKDLESLPVRDRMDAALSLSTTWTLIKDDLDSRNRRKILKAVYTVLQDEGLV